MARSKKALNPSPKAAHYLRMPGINWDTIDEIAGQEIPLICQLPIHDALWRLKSTMLDKGEWTVKRLAALRAELSKYSELNIAYDIKDDVHSVIQKIDTSVGYFEGKTEWDFAVVTIVDALQKGGIDVALTQNTGKISVGALIVKHLIETYTPAATKNSDNAFVKAIERALQTQTTLV